MELGYSIKKKKGRQILALPTTREVWWLARKISHIHPLPSQWRKTPVCMVCSKYWAALAMWQADLVFHAKVPCLCVQAKKRWSSVVINSRMFSRLECSGKTAGMIRLVVDLLRCFLKKALQPLFQKLRSSYWSFFLKKTTLFFCFQQKALLFPIQMRTERLKYFQERTNYFNFF